MKSTITRLGEYALLVVEVVSQVFSRPIGGGRLLHELERVGVRSLLVVAVTALFTGMVLGLQTAHALAMFQATLYMAEIVSLSVVRELGPVLTALIFAGRVGSGIAAELGSMVVTDQIDAMRTLGASPVKKLVVPKLLATMLMLPCLTVFSDAVGILGGMLVAIYELGISGAYYLSRVESALYISDVMSGISKAACFGFLIATISCYVGLATTGGADGVGRATTRAVVFSSVAVLVSDFFLTKLFLTLPDY